jgi:hypothetical protein
VNETNHGYNATVDEWVLVAAAETAARSELKVMKNIMIGRILLMAVRSPQTSSSDAIDRVYETFCPFNWIPAARCATSSLRETLEPARQIKNNLFGVLWDRSVR